MRSNEHSDRPEEHSKNIGYREKEKTEIWGVKWGDILYQLTST